MPETATRKRTSTRRLATSSLGSPVPENERKVAVILTRKSNLGAPVRVLIERALVENDEPRWKIPQISQIFPTATSNLIKLLKQERFSLSPHDYSLEDVILQPVREQLPTEEAIRKGFSYTETIFVHARLLSPAPQLDESHFFQFAAPAEAIPLFQTYRRKAYISAFTDLGLLPT